MEEYFKCSACHELIKEFFESECCGKLYCSTCVGKLVNVPCEFCNDDLHFSKNSFAERIVKLIKVSCKYNCGQQFSYDEMRVHLLNCSNKIFECSFKNCSFKGKKQEMHQHLIQEHYMYLLVMMENYQTFEKKLNEIEKGGEKNEIGDKDDETLVYFANSSIGNEIENENNSLLYLDAPNIFRQQRNNSPIMGYREGYRNYFVNEINMDRGNYSIGSNFS